MVNHQCDVRWAVFKVFKLLRLLQ
uniref:Uncharacterized protein n=1 Tax=Anguilla anguilla TaxID=7936 RepID=A0A0E9SH31_ANGAN